MSTRSAFVRLGVALPATAVIALGAAGCGESGGQAGGSRLAVASASQRATADVGGQAQSLLQDLSTAAEQLANGSRTQHLGIIGQLSSFHDDARNVASNARHELRRSNPARGILNRVGDAAASTALGLGKAQWTHPARLTLYGLARTLEDLAVAASSLTTQVQPAQRRLIDADIAQIHRQLAAAAAGI